MLSLSHDLLHELRSVAREDQSAPEAYVQLWRNDRRRLAGTVGIVIPDTILRWYLTLVARKIRWLERATP